MIRRPTSALAVALATAVLVAACGATATPVPTAAPATPAPTVAPTSAPTAEPTLAPTPIPTPAGPYANANYSLELPAGWVAFDMNDPAGEAALDAFVQANPEMAGSIEAFKALPNVVMAVNQNAGSVIVSVSIPTLGLGLDLIAAQFTSQFAAVPGVKEPPVAEDVTITAGPAKHWHLVIEANKPGGGTQEVGESIYVTTNATTAVLVEFVEVGGAPVPDENQIIQTLAFK